LALKTIDGILLKDMISAGAALLEKNRQAVDQLNVFPVPDGDTGTNMSQTMNAAVREMTGRDLVNAGEIMQAVARGALKGARGNSGVILSQIFRGFAKAAEGAVDIDAALLRDMLRQGAETAYKAIMKPKEGTILTVIRVIAEEVDSAFMAGWDLIDMMDYVLRSGDAILRQTTDMLPALKQAGVVDSGGKGLCIVLKGFMSAMQGEHIDSAVIETGEVALPGDFVDDHDSLEEITFGYCTEFIVSHPNEDCTDSAVARFRSRLEKIGDCVVVVSDGEVVKVHVHTNDPGKAIQMGLALGELDSIKVDNMLEEFRERMEKRLKARQAEQKEFGMVAVSLGEGLASILTDLGVDMIVDGGQTMNPSIDDIIQAIEKVNARTVFVFPNNSNIIMAADQAAQIVSDKNVLVVPTRSVPQGISAAVAFMPDDAADANLENMKSAAQSVKTGQVTYAVRDTTLDGAEIHEGDIMGLMDGKISSIGQSVQEVSIDLLRGMVDDDSELITVFYGKDTSEDDANELAGKLGEIFPDCDIELHMGGQPLYYYLFSVE
jgi:DAK2 domain fusion protein YloV